MPYSQLFFLGTCETEQVTVYTVPADYVAVLRDVEWFNVSGETIACAYLVPTVPGPLSAVVGAVNDLANGTADHWQGRVVLPAGSELATPALGTELFVTVSGYLLSSP